MLLVLLGTLAGSAAFRESVAVDEIAHIGAGVSYLQKLDLRFNPEHPPLVKVLAAAPLVLGGVRADYQGPIWTFSGEGLFNPMMAEWPFGAWILSRWNEPAATLRWARLPMLLLLLATGLVVYTLGERLGGGWGGVFSLCWFATTPTFLTFGPLVLTDTAVALFSILTLWCFGTLWRDRSRPALLRFALALALALLSKFSAGILLVVFAVYPFLLRRFPLPGQPTGAEFRAWRWRGWLETGKGVLASAVLVYAVEFVLSWNEPTELLKVLGVTGPALALRRVLLPAVTYLAGVFLVTFGSLRPTYLLGKAYPHGVWFFFPVVALLKSTLAFVAALALSVAAALGVRFRRPPASTIPPGAAFQWRALWLGILIFTTVCLVSPMTISIRHFTVPLALLCLLLSPVPRLIGGLPSPLARLGVVGAAALAVLSVTTVVMAWPNYMPFLNSLVSGRPGYEVVSDSNLDWDLSLPEVERFVVARGLQHVLVDSYNVADSSVYVPQGEYWDCQAPTAADAGQWAFVSANMFADGANCRWLLSSPKEALAGGSVYAIHLPAEIPEPGSPGGPPLKGDYKFLGGAPFDWRLMLFSAIRDPDTMAASMSRMKALYEEEQKKHKK